MRIRFSLAIAGMAVSLGTGAVQAQDSGPKAGTWAVEGTTGSAALLRFSSATSAWSLNASGVLFRSDNPAFDPATGTLVSRTKFAGSGQLRLGRRKYSSSEGAVRHFRTASLIIGFQETGATGGWQFGAGGELGAAYFFSPHVSMGGAAELSAVYQPENDRLIRQSFNLNLSGVRLAGTVYF